MFGKRLKELRKANNKRQIDMANFLNIREASYGRYENEVNQPDFDTLTKLADYFGVSTDYLLGYSNENNRIEQEILKAIDEHAKANGVYDVTRYVEENGSLRVTTFSDMLNTCLSSKKYNYSELLLNAGLSKERLDELARGIKKPTTDELLALAKTFNVSTDYLIGFDNYNKKNTSNEVHRINVLGSVPAGIPLEAIEDIVDWEEIPAEWLKKGEYFALQLDGDSMSPKYLDKDVVIFKKQADVDCGQNALVYVNGYDATFKKIIKKEDGTIILQPLNPEYSPIVVSGDETFAVVGIPVEIRRKEDL